MSGSVFSAHSLYQNLIALLAKHSIILNEILPQLRIEFSLIPALTLLPQLNSDQGFIFALVRILEASVTDADFINMYMLVVKRFAIALQKC